MILLFLLPILTEESFIDSVPWLPQVGALSIVFSASFWAYRAIGRAQGSSYSLQLDAHQKIVTSMGLQIKRLEEENSGLRDSNHNLRDENSQLRAEVFTLRFSLNNLNNKPSPEEGGE